MHSNNRFEEMCGGQTLNDICEGMESFGVLNGKQKL